MDPPEDLDIINPVDPSKKSDEESDDLKESSESDDLKEDDWSKDLRKVLMIHTLKPILQPIHGEPSLSALPLIITELIGPADHRILFLDDRFKSRYFQLTVDLDKYRQANQSHYEAIGESSDEFSSSSEDESADSSEESLVEPMDESSAEPKAEPMDEPSAEPKVELKVEPKVELNEEDESKTEPKLLSMKALLDGPVMFYLGHLAIGSRGLRRSFLRTYRQNVLMKKYDHLSCVLVKAWILLVDFHLYHANSMLLWGLDRNLGQVVEVCLVFNYVLGRIFDKYDFQVMTDLPQFPEEHYPTRFILNNNSPLERQLEQICTKTVLDGSYHELFLPDSYEMAPEDYWEEFQGKTIREKAEIVELHNPPMVTCTPVEYIRAIEQAYDIKAIISQIKSQAGMHYSIHRRDQANPFDNHVNRIIAGALLVFTIDGLERYIR